MPTGVPVGDGVDVSETEVGVGDMIPIVASVGDIISIVASVGDITVNTAHTILSQWTLVEGERGE